MTQKWKQFIARFPISNPSSKILVDLSHFGIIKVSGPDAAKFLQGQFTCDVSTLEHGDHTLGAYCNIKGKIESLFRIWRHDADFYLRLPAGLVDPTMQELQKYAIFSKIELLHASNHISGFGISNKSIILNFIDPQLAILELKAGQRYEIYGPTQALEHAWHECIKHADHVDPLQWELLDIQAKIPEIYPETSGAFFPHDLNLPELGAVSFTKGCFRGQEIIARMQHRGNIKRSMHSFAGDLNGLNAGALITVGGAEQEAVAGTVVRTCVSTSGATVGLAVITESMLGQQLYAGMPPVELSLDLA